MPTVGTAFSFLIDEGPSLLGAPMGSMLYVGHRGDTSPWWHEKFAPALGITRLAVVDISHANMQSAEGITKELYCGDIRSPGVVPGSFDLVFWDEGPEHVPQEEALDIIRALKARHGTVLISCPWGYQQQGSGPSDPEFHHWGPDPDDFEAIGMACRAFGVPFPDGHGNLIAWI